jgi:hypothetical protein
MATWTVNYKDFSGVAHIRVVNIEHGDSVAWFMATDLGSNLPAQTGPTLGCGKQAMSPKGAIMMLLSGRTLISATPNI